MGLKSQTKHVQQGWRAALTPLVLALGLGASPGLVLAADWITLPAAPAPGAEGLSLQFRRDITLSAKPKTLPVKVSADNRFVLFVNGRRVASGPSRGDLGHWRYEPLDLAPYLKAGANVIAAQVWHDGSAAPLAQVSTGKSGFFLEAENKAQASVADSGAAWQVRRDISRTVKAGRIQLREAAVPGFYAAGAAETFNAALQEADWNAPVTRAVGWKSAVPANDGKPFPVTLVRDALPQQMYRAVPSGKVVRTTGIAQAGAFPDRPLVIPANTEATLLVDAGRVLAAYPELTVAGGAGATVSLAYTEGLYDVDKAPVAATGRPSFLPRFTDRSTVKAGIALGLTDTFRPAGQTSRFAPFWWRAWRFVEIKVKTGAEPLTLQSLKTFEAGYPFEERGRFVSNDKELNDIWRIGWHTARFDAHETYQDTAYWEQLQYIGDTRLQMLISYAVSGDARLAVQALDAFDQSRVVEGIPQSAYPSTTKNPIPPFALLWINSLHDYWRLERDPAVLRRTLPGARSVLDWYAPYLRDDGILRMTPGWLFVDWRPTLSEMNPRKEDRPDSCVITILYYGALRDAADLETAVGDPALAVADRAQAAKVRERLMQKCWVADRKMFADTPAKTGFSQHANVLAVLYDLVPKDEQRAMMERITLPEGIDAPEGIIPVTYYFAYYLAEAFDHAGMTDRYIGMLKPWREMARQHFTTWPENPDPSRSDSHAWSAHPTTGLLTYVAGIRSAAPGFAKVRVEPHLGALTSLDAAMAHPSGGLIETRYSKAATGMVANVTLPAGLTGEFVWKGKASRLRAGSNRIAMD